MDRLLLQIDCRSRLLDVLPERDLTHLMPIMTMCRVAPKQVLVQRGEPILYVYFPYDAVLATVVECREGGALEAVTTGTEGFAPLHALFGAERAIDTVVCTVEGVCARMRLSDVQHEMATNPRLRVWLEQYARAYQVYLAQRVACNRLHQLEQRYARTLLSLLDRTGGEFVITQEHLAVLLGVSRPALSSVAHTIQEEGAVAYSRGRVRMLDRRKLEQHACECYADTRAAYERLLGMRIG